MQNYINLLALDENFEIVSLLNYSNLQWNRKYYEAGNFSIEIPASQYLSSMKYVYTKDRREMGIITQRNYIVSGQKETYSLSGYFLEKLLDRRIVYQKSSSTNITNEPSWNNQEGKAETVAYAYFNAFKDITFTYSGNSYESVLNIIPSTDLKRGHKADHQRNGELLGAKIYKILKPSEMSYRVNYDFLTSKMMFEIWTGVDRTQTNTEDNNMVIFSTKFGNLKNPNIVIDESNYANGYVVSTGQGETSSTSETNVYVNLERTDSESKYDDIYVSVSANASKNSYDSEDEYIEALHNSGHTQLSSQVKKLNVDFDAMTGSYEYLVDFDLGDKCSIEIPEIQLSADAVLIGCYEVIKSGVNTLTLEFGDPITSYLSKK